MRVSHRSGPGGTFLATALSALARRLVVALALIGLLVHAGLPLLHQSRAAASPLDNTVIICSAFGVKVVQLADRAAATDDGQQPLGARIYYCPICLVQQMAGTAVLPEAVTLATPSMAVTAPAHVHTARFLALGRYSSLRARAPPAIA